MQQLDNNRIPAHVAIIMDGHIEGVTTAKKITEEAAKLGIKYLTLYTFSTENWNRPVEEIEALMNLVLTNLEEEIFMKNNVRFRMIGEMERLPASVQKRLAECTERTSTNTGMTMIVALSYSSRWEITKAVKHIATEVKNGNMPLEDITEDCISANLTTNFMPDPDLLIRTGGELRISNYLLWQCAYSEFYFTEQFWPDFNEESLRKAIAEYQQRQRRYGKTGEQISDEE